MNVHFKVLALVIGSCGLAFAGAAPAAAGPLPYASGIVQSDGTVPSGLHFTVAHTGTGQYIVTYDRATFGSVPAMTVTPFGSNGSTIAIANVYSEKKSRGQIVLTILSQTAGTFTPFGSGFQFTIVAT